MIEVTQEQFKTACFRLHNETGKPLNKVCEMVAQAFGYPNWNILKAKFDACNRASKPNTADVETVAVVELDGIDFDGRSISVHLLPRTEAEEYAAAQAAKRAGDRIDEARERIREFGKDMADEYSVHVVAVGVNLDGSEAQVSTSSAKSEPAKKAPKELRVTLDVDKLSRFAGTWPDGYTPERAYLVCEALTKTTGVHFCILWDYCDNIGYGGNSDFGVVIDGLPYIASSHELYDFLTHGNECPAQLELKLQPMAPEWGIGYNIPLRHSTYKGD